PALAGFVGGRPKASPLIKLFSFFIDKNQINVEIDFDGSGYPVEIPHGTSTEQIPSLAAGESAVNEENETQ
ncbi:terpene utilization protein AtuA, partial [Acinetobacter calcoaceticus]